MQVLESKKQSWSKLVQRGTITSIIPSNNANFFYLQIRTEEGNLVDYQAWDYAYIQLKSDLYNADENDAKIKEIMNIRDNVIKWSDYNEMFNR